MDQHKEQLPDIDRRAQMLRERLKMEWDMAVAKKLVIHEMRMGEVTPGLQREMDVAVDRILQDYPSRHLLHSFLRYVDAYSDTMNIHLHLEEILWERFEKPLWDHGGLDIMQLAENFDLVHPMEEHDMSLTLWGRTVLDRLNDLQAIQATKAAIHAGKDHPVLSHNML